jgi:hypothetical protein
MKPRQEIMDIALRDEHGALVASVKRDAEGTLRVVVRHNVELDALLECASHLQRVKHLMTAPPLKEIEPHGY